MQQSGRQDCEWESTLCEDLTRLDRAQSAHLTLAAAIRTLRLPCDPRYVDDAGDSEQLSVPLLLWKAVKSAVQLIYYYQQNMTCVRLGVLPCNTTRTGCSYNEWVAAPSVFLSLHISSLLYSRLRLISCGHWASTAGSSFLAIGTCYQSAITLTLVCFNYNLCLRRLIALN